MTINRLFVLVFLLFVIFVGDCARILVIMPIPFYSHNLAYLPLWKELSLRGHQVTVYTSQPFKDPSLVNLTEIDISSALTQEQQDVIVGPEITDIEYLIRGFSFLKHVTQNVVQHPEFRNLVRNESEHFDLVMVDYALALIVALSGKFKCPAIGLFAYDAPSFIHNRMGNPNHPILHPDINLSFKQDLSFFDRLLSLVAELIMDVGEVAVYLPEQEELFKIYFKTAELTVKETYNNISMIFMNTNPVLHPVRTLVPAIVQIGDANHLQPPNPLPQELKETLDNATQGCIYFSLGTSVRTRFISHSTRKIMLEVFSELPFTILWKEDTENFQNIPSNVVVSKWFPQQDLLRHPSVKLFITHAGLLSIYEAVYSYVPIVLLPFCGDQIYNAKNMVDRGVGVMLDYKHLDKESFRNAILEVINNPKYRNHMRKLAELARDQPMTGLERAVWWTEYVLRHKGAPLLKSPAADIPLYQYLLLDVIGFCVLVATVTLYLLHKLLKIIFKFLKFSLLVLKSKARYLRSLPRITVSRRNHENNN